MIKKLILLLFILMVLTVISGCELRKEELSDSILFVGEKTGLWVDFISNSPPDFNWKNDEFQIKVNIVNRGEYALLPGQAKIVLSGDFASKDFEADKTTKTVDKGLESGQSIEFSLGNAKYVGEIDKSKIVQAVVKTYYPYKSEYNYYVDVLKREGLQLKKDQLLGKKNALLSDNINWGYYCYAIFNKNDSYCANLENDVWKYLCYADANNDDNYCKKIEDKTWRNYCYAIRDKDDGYCKNIKDEIWKNYCYAVANEDVSYCKNMGDWGLYVSYKCFNEVTRVVEISQVCQESNHDNSNYCSAILTNESAYCEKIKDKEIKNFCFSFVADRTRDYSLCDNIENSTFLLDVCKTDVEYKDGCKNAEKKLIKYIEYKVGKIDNELKELDEDIALLNETTEGLFLFENGMVAENPIQIVEKSVNLTDSQLQIDFLIKNVGGGVVSTNCKTNGKVLIKTNNLACSELNNLDGGLIELNNRERTLHCKVEYNSKEHAFINLSYEYQQEFKKDILVASRPKKLFLGGIGGLLLDFVPDNPPDFNWKGEEFPIRVNITNRGEHALLPREAKIALSGDFASKDFEADKTTKIINKELESGQSIEFSLGNVKYVGEINKSKIVQAVVKTYYPYKTKFRTDLYMLNSDVLCNKEGFASAGPVEVLWPVISLADNTASVDLIIRNVAEGFVDDEIKVTASSDRIFCPHLIKLENKSATLHCEIKNVKDNLYVAIDLDYDYQHEFKKSIMIKDREAFPFD